MVVSAMALSEFVGGQCFSKEHAASIFSPEDRVMFLLNVDIYLQVHKAS